MRRRAPPSTILYWQGRPAGASARLRDDEQRQRRRAYQLRHSQQGFLSRGELPRRVRLGKGGAHLVLRPAGPEGRGGQWFPRLCRGNSSSGRLPFGDAEAKAVMAGWTEVGVECELGVRVELERTGGLAGRSSAACWTPPTCQGAPPTSSSRVEAVRASMPAMPGCRRPGPTASLPGDRFRGDAGSARDGGGPLTRAHRTVGRSAVGGGPGGVTGRGAAERLTATAARKRLPAGACQPPSSATSRIRSCPWPG